MLHDGTLYLLDANALITSERMYYPKKMVPELWAWILHQGQNGRIKVPLEIYEEIQAGKEDELTIWLNKPEVKQSLLLEEDVSLPLVQHVVNNGYAADLNENEIAFIGKDPFLISYALASPQERCVVSLEVSKPRTQRQNRRVPDVCKDLGADCCNIFQLMKILEFHTGWEAALNQGSIQSQ